MTATRRVLWTLCAALFGCAPESAGPDARLAPLFATGGAERHTIVVNPDANGNGVAATIQEGIDRVAPGGTVLVRPGRYAEALIIDKALTLQGIADGNGPVIIAPPGTPARVIDVATFDPVTLRDITVQVPGAAGIIGVGPVDLTVERAVVVAVNPPLGVSNVILVINDAGAGARARMTVRESFIDGTITSRPLPFPQSFGLRSQGDVDALLEGNVIRRTGGACIFVVTRADLAGELNVDIVNNDLDECHPAGRVAAVLVGPVAGNVPSPTRPLTATGRVNLIGNTIRNTSLACVTSAAIVYEVYTGRIERNRILNVVQPCATPTLRNLPGAIWLGRLNQPLFPAVTPTVRFNDIIANAHAGLRIAANQTSVIDATCNYWGSGSGPSGVGSGSGDALVVEAGGATPVFTPFATAPIAGTGATSC